MKHWNWKSSGKSREFFKRKTWPCIASNLVLYRISLIYNLVNKFNFCKEIPFWEKLTVNKPSFSFINWSPVYMTNKNQSIPLCPRLLRGPRTDFGSWKLHQKRFFWCPHVSATTWKCRSGVQRQPELLVTLKKKKAIGVCQHYILFPTIHALDNQ